MRVNPANTLNLCVLVVVFSLTPAVPSLADRKGDVSLMLGQRQDNLDWNIRGGTGPNILSELTWRDLKSTQLRGDYVTVNARDLYFRGSASLGWVQSGENQDSDYAGDNRTLEWSRSVNGVDGSMMMDFKGGIGKRFPLGDRGRHHYAPVFGLSYHSQQLKMTDGRQVIPPDGPIRGLNSSYDATWLGIWLGLDVEFDLADRGRVTLRMEGHRSSYDAEANWNLRDDFVHPVSFEHDANANGLVMELGWRSPKIHRDWQWGANLGWQYWKTEPGTDRTYVRYYDDELGNQVFCTPYCIGIGRLNEVNWSSSQINITLSREISP